ncbi:hypothetical protein GDO86_015467 [Hymenochirus boettgeri]|uniref:Uncharacterized protein n=1 Tax=Hymenochirus boettgeri TaxID=247094 RepID=A0A8T2JY03_9PIPI|nr:hypothetical protein GDO86_015467 [Hymenochirus boettgeri]
MDVKKKPNKNKQQQKKTKHNFILKTKIKQLNRRGCHTIRKWTQIQLSPKQILLMVTKKKTNKKNIWHWKITIMEI